MAHALENFLQLALCKLPSKPPFIKEIEPDPRIDEDFEFNFLNPPTQKEVTGLVKTYFDSLGISYDPSLTQGSLIPDTYYFNSRNSLIAVRVSATDRSTRVTSFEFPGMQRH